MGREDSPISCILLKMNGTQEEGKMINCSLDVKALVMTEADLVLGSVTENRGKHKCLVVLLGSGNALGVLN